MATLLINVLLNHGQQLVYIPGLAVNRASAGYRGVGKTDAKDATVIADQARMRRDLTIVQPDDERAVEPRILTDRRADLNADRTRRINRLRSQLTSIFPALERALDLGNVGPLVLLTGYQPPAALRAPAAAGSRPGSEAARSAVPKPSPRPPWKRPSASTPPSPGRRSPRRWTAGSGKASRRCSTSRSTAMPT